MNRSFQIKNTSKAWQILTFIYFYLIIDANSGGSL